MNDEPRIELQTRGTRILTGSLAKKRREIISICIEKAEAFGAQEIILPTIEPTQIYTNKAGQEILEQMYIFPDRKNRSLCLRPEGTATCQLLASGPWQNDKNIKLWYEARCFRYERPQAGRYREFTQFGVEILNPTQDCLKALEILAYEIVFAVTKNESLFILNSSVKRGLAYYIDNGFEISCPSLGAQKQVCGGGVYKEGIGFAIGIDRLLMLTQEDNNGEI